MSTTPARHLSDLTRLQRRRLSWCVAKGVPLGKAARRVGLDGPATSDLLQDQGFSALVEAYRSMLRMPEDERHRRLVEMALLVIEEAIARLDPRVALFVIKQHTRGRDPAEVLARGVVKALDRQERPPEPPADWQSAASPPAPAPREPSCPVDNATGKAASMLRSEILDEVEFGAAVQTPDRDRRVRTNRWMQGVRRRGRSGAASSYSVRPDDGAAPDQLEADQPAAQGQKTPPERPPISLETLTPRQMLFLQTPVERRVCTTPETDPHNPNAPND